jgi:hypothetical protein
MERDVRVQRSTRASHLFLGNARDGRHGPGNVVAADGAVI